MISMPFTLKINSSTTQEEYLETIEPLMDLIAYAGCQTMTKIEERDKLVFFLVQMLTVKKVKDAALQ